MSDDSRFLKLLEALRKGDGQAARELHAEYEPYIHRAVRTRLRNEPALRRVVDAEDVCQSVMRSFFLRYHFGQYELGGPDELRGLLHRMMKNKYQDLRRRHYGGNRDGRRNADLPPGGEVPAPERTPSSIVGWKELLYKAEERFSLEERDIYRRSQEQGLTWAQIAEQLGGTAEGRRKQWERACKRVMQELDL